MRKLVTTVGAAALALGLGRRRADAGGREIRSSSRPPGSPWRSLAGWRAASSSARRRPTPAIGARPRRRRPRRASM